MAVLKFDPRKVEELVRSLKATDEVMLVGDQGVYLMATAQEAGKRLIVYAKGCDPTIDSFDDWWENKNALFGGDDGADPIGRAGELLPLVVKASTFDVLMTKNSMQVRVGAGGK